MPPTPTPDRLGNLDTSGALWILRYERELAHPPAAVWRQIATPEGLADWFPARVGFEALTPGAAMTFTFEQADLDRAADAGVEDVPRVSDGIVREVVEHRLLAFDWLDEPIRFELTPLEGGARTRLVFTHAFAPDREQAPRNATGWHVCLAALEAAVSGATLDDPEALQADLLEAYRRDLALPPGHA